MYPVSIFPRGEQRVSIVAPGVMDDGIPLPPDPQAILLSVLRAIWRWRRIFLIVFLAVAAGGGAVLALLPARYTAHATVMVGFRVPELLPGNQTWEPPRIDPDLDGAIELMKSPATLRLVAERLHLADRPEFARLARTQRSKADAAPEAADLIADRLGRQVKIDRIGRSTLVDVAYTAADPAFAAELATTLATVAAEDESHLAHMTMVERTGFQIMKTSLVAAAPLPLEPSAPNLMVILAGTLLCAAGAALTAVLLRENRARQTVLSTEEIARRGLRPLGLLPCVADMQSREGAVPQEGAAPPDLACFNAVTSLQAALTRIATPDQVGGTVLLFTSALPAEGKSTTVAMLAAGFAEAGSNVLLVDADLRSPSLHQTFGMSLSPGLTDCVDMESDFTALVRRDQATGVAVVTAGNQHTRPLAILTSPRLRQALATWRRTYDFVLIDSPPVLAAGDARLLGLLADYSVFVVHWGKTGWTTLGQAMRLQAEGGARIGGVVISRVNVKELAKYDCIEPWIYGSSSGRRDKSGEH